MSANTAELGALRPGLGDFMSLVCFKAAIRGVEDTLGEDGASVLLVRAGKLRGHDVARAAGLVGSEPPLETLAATLDAAFGASGTRLCHIERISRDGEQIVVVTHETVCSAGEPAGSERKCTYTLGAVAGAIEAVMGRTYRAEHTESVLRGAQSDTFVLSPL